MRKFGSLEDYDDEMDVSWVLLDRKLGFIVGDASECISINLVVHYI